jgi:predicted ATPase
MISVLKLHGFKSFVDAEISLKRLTLLTGINSSGKSSIIQALLMLQKAENAYDSVLLDGHGGVKDIKNPFINDEIILGIEDEKGSKYSINITEEGDYNETKENWETGDFPHLFYISANRFGPKNSIPLYNDHVNKFSLGQNGENTLQLIALCGDQSLDESLRHPNSEGLTLEYNIRGWLSVISPNVEFKYHIQSDSDSSYSTFNGHRSNNVGYGLSYSLPVITALLYSTLYESCIVIIENPEAHLHPRGQTEMGKLIALCAKAGSQIIIETHSDHIFDGIRIFTKNNQEFESMFQLHWFELNDKKNTEITSPTVDENGRIDSWLQGFFDQFEINASQLL